MNLLRSADEKGRNAKYSALFRNTTDVAAQCNGRRQGTGSGFVYQWLTMIGKDRSRIGPIRANSGNKSRHCFHATRGNGEQAWL